GQEGHERQSVGSDDARMDNSLAAAARQFRRRNAHGVSRAVRVFGAWRAERLCDADGTGRRRGASGRHKREWRQRSQTLVPSWMLVWAAGQSRAAATAFPRMAAATTAPTFGFHRLVIASAFGLGLPAS